MSAKSDNTKTTEEALSPVHLPESNEDALALAGQPSFSSLGIPRDGIALCLSGGGYRAMLFHLGALWRLNELGYLSKLSQVSSVSGGSITSGLMALKWSKLNFNGSDVVSNFDDEVVAPLRGLAAETIDVYSVLEGALLPGDIADRVAADYRRYLFGHATLQDMPDRPFFVMNATNVQSGALWRFTKRYMRDYRVGEIKNPKVDLAVAVAASSAFPPVLSPLEMDLNDSSFTPNYGQDLQRPPYTTKVLLTDGGVYDNLGLETAWKNYKTVLVSDGGGKMNPEEKPKRDWVRHSIRVLDLIDNQVRSLRKRQVIDSYVLGTRQGAYWGIRTNIADYELDDAMDCPVDKTLDLANIPTRLKALDALCQERLINWGYAVCDAAMRKHVDPALPTHGDFPYPDSGVG
jgi:NTE family protein